MAMAFESEQVGKRQSWANIIANIQTEATPFTSMAQKRARPAQVLQSWQVKSYPDTGHAGVVDGQDATSFDSNPRKLVQCNGQKTWRKPGVSDFADEAEIVALNKGEMAEQIADSLVLVKRQIEKRALSNDDTKNDDGVSVGNETRGMLSWISNSAQTLYPVPEGFRTPSAQCLSLTVATSTESAFAAACASSFVQRKGPFKMDAFLGIYLKQAFTNFSKYVDGVNFATSSATANSRVFNQDASSRALINTIDKLVMDTGTIDLHSTAFLYTTAATGADTAYTHRSGIVVDMDMVGLAYTRMPRVVKLPYAGGGQKAIVDAIFLVMADNVLGAMKIVNGS